MASKKQDPSGLFSSKCALLLCRVLCGALWRIEHSDPSATKEAVAQNFDSVLGDREHAVGSYREFVVPRPFWSQDCMDSRSAMRLKSIPSMW